MTPEENEQLTCPTATLDAEGVAEAVSDVTNTTGARTIAAATTLAHTLGAMTSPGH